MDKRTYRMDDEYESDFIDDTDLVEKKKSSEKKSTKRLKKSKSESNNTSNKLEKARKFIVDNIE
jgi:hypothetical protein